jgi:DNA-directed RNA polymerase specialized sigma24 family protein
MAEDSRFPLTRHSVVAATGSTDVALRQRAWETLAGAYWKPVYKYLRLQWRVDVETAGDWTQEFFARAMAKDFFAGFDPARARFRTFLRVCLDGFAHNQRTAERRLKRGGGVAPLSLDFAAAEGELAGVAPPAPDCLDDYFHREWLRSLFEMAIGDLERACAAAGKMQALALFRRHDLEAPERAERPSYAQLAQEFEVPVTQVTNWLHWTRQRLRESLLERLRQLCTSEDEYRDELRALLGVVPG